MPKLCLNMIVKNEGSLTHPILKYLKPHRTMPKAKVRIGGDTDGGYVMLYDFDDIEGVISYGVGTVEIAGEDCISFEIDLATRGLPIVMFDHTIPNLPSWHPNFVFFKEGVGPLDKKKTKTIKTHIKPYRTNNLILKMDVEGAEYDAINATPPATLRKFRQIILEVHDLTRMNEPEMREKQRKMFARLDKDFILHHVHGNNTAKFGTVDGFKVLDVLELSYVRRDLVDIFPPTEKFPAETFPTVWDRPCWPKFPDVKLDFYPFVEQTPKIIRCLKSVAPWIDSWVIYDTGSSDDTISLIEEFFAGRRIPGHVARGHFTNFEQARNDALQEARASAEYDWDYLLLCDADMELVVDNMDFRDGLKGQSHSMIQRSGGLSYANSRFISREATGWYVGVTHEYLNIPDAGVINGAWYRDHCDGANRPEKYVRDIRLLETALKKEPENGRYWYYLGSTYADAGNPEKAEAAYLKRIELGGWPEETWSAIYKRAHALRAMGKEADGIRELLSAYNFRPNRAEPLYDLAKLYREKGMNYASLAIAEEGLRIPYPSDVLFVQDYPYETGMLEEFAICAYYDPRRRQRGFEAANKLSLDPKGSWQSRETARGNLLHYVKPLNEQFPSFIAQRIDFPVPYGFTAMNPCITRFGKRLVCLVRTVNYTMDEHGRYLIKGTNGEANQTNPINTRNFLVNLNSDWAFEPFPDQSLEVLPPEGFPPPVYPLVVGCEDMRIFQWRNELWSISNIREQNAEGWCEQYMARIFPSPEVPDPYQVHLTAGRFLRPDNRQHEKNWMPFILESTGELRFVYRPGWYLNPETMEVRQNKTPFDDGHISGGSQMIRFMGGYLGVVHEARPLADGKRWYQHRFMYIDKDNGAVRYSLPFVFHEKVIEFAAGMCWHPDNKHILISYGREDKEAWVCSIDAFELAEFVNGA